jgi:hypothetical protein
VKNLIIVTILATVLAINALAQPALKFGLGAGFVPKMTTYKYGFATKGGLYLSAYSEAQIYFGKIGVSADIEVSTLSMTRLDIITKFSDGRWNGVRQWAFCFGPGLLNKSGGCELTLATGTDLYLGNMFPKITWLKNFDWEVRLYLPGRMFSSAEMIKDVSGRSTVFYRIGL